MPRWRGKRSKARQFGTLLVVATAFLPAALTGCESLRLHDEGRFETAQEITATGAELTAQGGAVFGPMEDNLDKVKATQAKLRELSNQHEYETFKVIAAGLTADELGERLAETMRDRNAAFADFDRREQLAVEAVNAALDRQKLISDAITRDLEAAKTTAEEDQDQARAERLDDLMGIEQGTGARSLSQTLFRVDEWLDWIDRGLQRFHQAQAEFEALAAAGGVGAGLGTILSGLGDDVNQNAAVISGFVADAQSAVDQVEQDEQVQAARKLLNATIQETAAAEQQRLAEFRRHLAEIGRRRARLEVRDAVSVCKLYLRALGRVYFGASDPVKEDLADVTTALRNSGRYDLDSGTSCLPELRGIAGDGTVAALWDTDRLDAFVASSLASDTQPEAAVELVGAVAILGFHERAIYEDARLELAREQHRHSIRLSGINAAQRAQMVHQLAQGLAIYYEGGVRPEEVAQLLLLAAQVGGIFFIGAQL